MSARTATLAYCSAALLLFAILSYSAASTKSATYDEPIHAAAAYTHLRYGDFSVEPDHPPLWKYWAALPLLAGPAVDTHRDSRLFRGIPAHIGWEWPWCVTTLYRTPGNNPERIVGAARLMMLLLGVALGAVTAAFAYRAAGPVAACAAVTLFALDPNFLAHASLVKNDVALTLATTALAFALWRSGRALTWTRLAALAVLCAACVTTKFTGLLAAPLVTVALLVRALLPDPWPVLGRTLATRGRRLLAACAACLACAAFTYVAIWGVYLFRFDPSPVDPGVHYDTGRFLRDAAVRELAARHVAPAPDALAAWRPGPSLQAGLFALDHHLFPESFLNGLIYADTAARSRYAYLLGDVYPGGRWYYFPVAFVVKTPLATLAALLLAAVLAFLVRRGGQRQDDGPAPLRIWLWTCLALPVLIFGLTAIVSSLNIGVRHIFPVYPPLFVAAGIVVARLYAQRPKVVRAVLALLAVGLAAETLSAFPNYIPFFNVAAGGYRGGYRVLSDSNLDWGQDLPLLADWQRRHPDRTLHLCYFGSADPAYYGIRYRNLPYGYGLGPERPDSLPTSGVVAISVSKLQNMLVPDPPHNRTYDPFRNRAPTEILGGSIYLFDLGGD